MIKNIVTLSREDKTYIVYLLVYFANMCSDINLSQVWEYGEKLGITPDNLDKGIDDYLYDSLSHLSYLPKEKRMDIYCFITFFISESDDMLRMTNELQTIALVFELDFLTAANEASFRIGQHWGFC